MVKYSKTSKKTLYFALALSFLLNTLLLAQFYPNSFKEELDINVLESYELSQDLINYREPSMIETNIPNKSPFGGIGADHIRITSNFMDAKYAEIFGENHYALDMVPNDNYYKNMPFFLSRSRALVFATHNGTAQYLYDEFGANYLIITNPEQTLRTMYVHLEAAYVATDDVIETGQIIGVMGNTGKSTASHLHYAVQTKNAAGGWQYVNPNLYIN